MKVVKRSGKVVDFDITKITKAIAKAGEATGEFDYSTAESITNQVLELIGNRNGNGVAVEFIQDCVEKVLMSSPYKATAKAYIIYREQRAMNRELSKKFGLDLIDKYLDKSDWRVKENSNMNFSLQGLNNFVASELSKKYWLRKLYPKEVRQAYEQGYIHIHDLGSLSAYCVGWDLFELLLKGFGGVDEKINCRPPRHFGSALGQLVNFLYTLQGECAGAQAVSSVDTFLAPFIAYDKLTYSEVKQEVQEFVYNLNVPTRVGFQTPFTNISLDLVVPKKLRDSYVLVGGEVKDRKYSEFQNEMDMFNRALFEVLIEGDASGRVFTFPIPTINVTRDFDWNSPVIDLIMQATAKYGIPYFANFVNSDLNPDDVFSMCCRLRLDTTELRARGGGLFGSNPLTGSIGVVTVNLPRVAYESNSEEEFFSHLDNILSIAKTSLEIKRKTIEDLTENNLYPYSKYYLSSVKKKSGKYWSNHFSTIGIIGMNEAVANSKWLNEPGIWTVGGREFSVRVLEYIRSRILQFQKETGNIYNLEATPAEGASYRLAKLDKQMHPEIVTQGRKHPYYTNSTWLPVGFSDDIFFVLEHQDTLQTLYTGGTVLHLFLSEKPDTEVLKNFLQKVFTKYKLPYLSFTPSFSVCRSCGYFAGEHFSCPTCGKETEVYSRVVGYLRPVKSWNEGKVEEFLERKKFDSSIHQVLGNFNIEPSFYQKAILQDNKVGAC